MENTTTIQEREIFSGMVKVFSAAEKELNAQYKKGAITKREYFKRRENINRQADRIFSI